MLDIKTIRDNPEAVKTGLGRRGADVSVIDKIAETDKKRRAIIQDVEALKAQNNKVSGEIAKMKKEGKDASGIIADMKAVTDK